MENNNVHCAMEFLKNRLYLAVIDSPTGLKKAPKSTANTHFFTIDYELVYENFYSDFGPLNIGMLYKYCTKLEQKFKMIATQTDRNIKIVHYTIRNPQKFTNAAFLICAYVMLYHNKDPYEAYRPILDSDVKTLIQRYRDASYGDAQFTISILDCLRGLDKARKLNFFDFEDFDLEEYEYYEQVPNGDFNWILPGKFLAFCGPHSEYRVKHGYTLHSPETYLDYFKKNNVTDVIRLNRKAYDGAKFTKAGINHHDMVFLDGSYPSDYIMTKFLDVCEKAKGAIAVHCKAGLGRTGSLIGCYIMKHFRFHASETIAWLRLCRPGSVIGCQQQWLESKEVPLWMSGDIYRKNDSNINLNDKMRLGIYSKCRHNELYNIRNANLFKNRKVITPSMFKSHDTKDLSVQKVLSAVNTLKINDQPDKGIVRMKRYVTRNTKYIEDAANQNTKSETELINGMSQGDRLSQIKANRHARSATTGRVHSDEKPKSIRSGIQDDSSIRPLRSKEPTLSPLKSKKVSAIANAQKESFRETSRRILRSANVNSQKRITSGARPVKSPIVR